MGVPGAPVQCGTVPTSCRWLVAPSQLNQRQMGPWTPEDLLLAPACTLPAPSCPGHLGTGEGNTEGMDPYSSNANRVLGL